MAESYGYSFEFQGAMVDLFVAFCWIYVGLDYPLWQYLRARYRIVFVWSSTVSGSDPRLGCWDDLNP